VSIDDIRRDVIAIVAEIAEVEPAQVGAEATLESLGIDSLDGLRIVAAVEKRFDIVIEEAEIGRIRTMPDIFALVEARAADVG
jgi:acyl carrier protein